MTPDVIIGDDPGDSDVYQPISLQRGESLLDAWDNLKAQWYLKKYSQDIGAMLRFMFSKIPIPESSCIIGLNGETLREEAAPNPAHPVIGRIVKGVIDTKKKQEEILKRPQATPTAVHAARKKRAKRKAGLL